MIYTLTLNPALDKMLSATGLEPEAINRAQVIRCDWGGKGINVSRALRNLGLESVAMGFVGGVTGEMLRRGLAAMGIATAFVPVTGETRTNLTIHDQARGALIKLNEAGPTVGTAEIEALQAAIRQRAGRGDLWVMSGNLPPGASDDLYAKLITIVQGQGGQAFLDASGEPLRLGCIAQPYLVKPNRAEAEEVLERKLEDEKSLRWAVTALLERGTEVALLSMAADGAIVARKEEVYWARPPQVIVHSSIGAGDALLAGFIYASCKGQPLAECLRWGVAAGTAAAMEEGTKMCTLERTKVLLPQVTVSSF